MKTNKPGSVNQQPLYGCTNCYKDFSWPAGDLRVYENECWCDLCWGERRWVFPDLPYWDDLEPYTPNPDVSALVEALEQCITSMLDSGYRADAVVIRAARAALAAHQQGGAE